MFEAIRDILRGLRDLEERTTREFLELSRKSKSSEIKNTLYALLAEKIIHTEILRGLLRAYDRLEDLAWEIQQLPHVTTEVDEKELHRMQLKLEELQALEERIVKLLDLYVDEMDRRITSEVLRVLKDNEKNVSVELENLLAFLREKLKQIYSKG